MLGYNNHNCNQSKIPALLHGQQTLPGTFELPLKYPADVKLDLAFFPLVIVTSFAVSSLINPRSFQKSFYCRIRQAVVFRIPID